jgi:Cytochrome c554 and c-prime
VEREGKLQASRAQRASLCFCIRILSSVSVLLLAVSQSCSQNQPSASPQSQSLPLFTGDAACASCHQKEAAAWPTNPHHLDSAPATGKTILGDFTRGKNVVHSGIPDVVFTMVASRDGFLQTVVDLNNPDGLRRLTQRFDIVIGSGRRGQTYLYWQGDRLFELPISYWSYTKEWINSPDYPPDSIDFDRPIIPRCLECHATWFRALGEPNYFESSSLILGIGCEKCHGPGAEHVARERSAQPPAAGSPEIAIANPARFTHDRQMDLCSLCHAGLGRPLRPALSYQPGDVLADDLSIVTPPSRQPIDVHGNQVSALERSKCYLSGRLTCSTCHNVHERQEDVDFYSAHCLECHTAPACPRFKVMGDAIRTRCVECHMPEGKSNSLHSDTEGRFLQAELRTHLIAIYPGAAPARPGSR